MARRRAVTAEDCVASLKRWGKGDGMGQKLFDFTESLEANRRQDDHAEVEGALRSRFGIDRQAIVAGAVHDAEAARGNAADQADSRTDRIGTVQVRGIGIPAGWKAVYEKNTDYVPRKEAPSWTSGA